MWEDEANKFGGKWIVRLRKGNTGAMLLRKQTK